MLKVKIIYNPISSKELEEEVTEFINREDVGQIHEVQFSGHAVMIMYEENTDNTPEPFFEND